MQVASDDEISNAETIPASDTMLEQVRQIPTAVRRGQAAGPIHLHGSSSS